MPIERREPAQKVSVFSAGWRRRRGRLWSRSTFNFSIGSWAHIFSYRTFLKRSNFGSCHIHSMYCTLSIVSVTYLSHWFVQRTGDVGIIESITLKNFMCHAHLGPFTFGPNVNFVVGNNGSKLDLFLSPPFFLHHLSRVICFCVILLNVSLIWQHTWFELVESVVSVSYVLSRQSFICLCGVVQYVLKHFIYLNIFCFSKSGY